MTLRRTVTAFLAMLVLLGWSGAAHAQRGNTVILVLDQEKVLVTSKAGQSISAQLQVIGQQVAAEIQAQEQAVQQESEALKASQPSLSKEDFTRRYQALLEKGRNVEQLMRIREAELQQAQSMAYNQLAAAWEPIVDDIFKKRKGTVLMDRQAVLSAADANNITSEVITRLDKEIQTIQVVKPDLQAQRAAALAQQKSQ
ncbi:MAG: OmpH family outer membrane protein [Pseudomonadota bacterium]